jgi:hypothetical protein
MRGTSAPPPQLSRLILHGRDDLRRSQASHRPDQLPLTGIQNANVTMNVRDMSTSQRFVTGLFVLGMMRSTEAAPRQPQEAVEAPLRPADLRQGGTYVGRRGSHAHQGVQHPTSPIVTLTPKPPVGERKGRRSTAGSGGLGRASDLLPRGRRDRHRHVIDTATSALAPPTHGARKMAMCPKPVRVVSIGTTDEPKGWFVFHIHVHDDVPLHMARDVAQRFDWWLREMLGLLPQGTGLHFRIVRGEKGLSDIDYTAGKGEDSNKGLKALKAVLARQGPCDTGLPMPRNYHLLLTAKQPYPGMRGLASPGARVGIASLSSPRTAGHELGHMLCATHEQGAVEWIGGSQRCATAMREERGWPFPDCGRFSPDNRKRIHGHLKDVWESAQARQRKVKA